MMNRPIAVRISLSSSSFPLVSTQLSVSSACRLAHTPNPSAVQSSVPITRSAPTAMPLPRMARFSGRGG